MCPRFKSGSRHHKYIKSLLGIRVIFLETIACAVWFLPWPSLLDLNFKWYREDCTDKYYESEIDCTLECELCGHRLDDVDSDEYLESEKYRSPYLFPDMSVDMLSRIMSICAYSTIESHEYSSDDDANSEYLDDPFHDEEYCVVVHIQ